MAEQEAQGAAGATAFAEGDFAALLNKEFRPRTDQAKTAVETAVKTLAQQALANTALISDDVVNSLAGEGHEAWAIQADVRSKPAADKVIARGGARLRLQVVVVHQPRTQRFQPGRAGLTGSTFSPPLPESLELLGRERAVERLRSPS